MEILRRQWTDGEKWIMGIVAAFVVAGGLAALSYLGGGAVELTIASQKDRYGRCVDMELVLENDTSNDARGIEIALVVDYFTERGDIEIEYGDRKEQMRTSAMSSLLPEREYMGVEYTVDSANHTIVIPHLKPNQYLHLYFGGEAPVGGFDQRSRNELLRRGDAALMDMPRVASATREDGTVDITRVRQCGD